jgi:hypothetical protein
MPSKHLIRAVAAVIPLFLSAFFIAGFPTVDAQTAQPQVLITWSTTNSYVPVGYTGKILPNIESSITASVELIAANGKPIDLSGQTIYWYENDNLLGGGIGAQQITFPPFGDPPNIIALRISIPDYPGGILMREINIPIVVPRAVIEAPYPQSTFSQGKISMQALPYFFAASSTAPLNFTWSVNDDAVASAENPQSLQISLPDSTPSGYGVFVSLTIQNSVDSLSATQSQTLTYQK